MALNVAFAQGRLYLAPGERILSFYDDVELQVKGGSFQGKQTAKGTVYLTQYRVIFTSLASVTLSSLSMAFPGLRELEVKQPIFGANSLDGHITAEPNGKRLLRNGQILADIHVRRSNRIFKPSHENYSSSSSTRTHHDISRGSTATVLKRPHAHGGSSVGATHVSSRGESERSGRQFCLLQSGRAAHRLHACHAIRSAAAAAYGSASLV
ncbi:postacrosomal sheath WW domain-binding protein-like isoform X2 [Oscarella lobularis]|uniref:postacrosomal sheath WW domain-binding protein-like isoform X2 n=1 Tax=Oscarella lobularis TaxID=121494 RepID=UPI0033136967